MSILQSILYGLVSGFSEVLPVSSQAHQAILMRLFGLDTREPLRDLLIHISVLLAIITGCRATILRLKREKDLSNRRRRGRKSTNDSAYELRLIRTAAVPMLIVLLIYLSSRTIETNLTTLALMLVINGIALIIPEHMRQANKDARSMTGFDGILIGVAGGLSALPGISRIGAISSYALMRGAEKQKVLSWAFLLSIPALFLLCIIDVVLIFSIGVGAVSFLSVLGYILSAITAYLGAYFGIIFVRYLAVRTGYTGFAYYSWGTALFTMILYLIV